MIEILPVTNDDELARLCVRHDAGDGDIVAFKASASGRLLGNITISLCGDEARLLTVFTEEEDLQLLDGLVRAAAGAAQRAGAVRMVCRDPSLKERLAALGFIPEEGKLLIQLSTLFQNKRCSF